jgi:hypothetical protein
LLSKVDAAPPGDFAAGIEIDTTTGLCVRAAPILHRLAHGRSAEWLREEFRRSGGGR